MRYCTAISKKSRFELSRNISSRRPLPPSVKRKRSKAAKGGKKSSGAGSERVPEPACIRVNGRRLPCVCVCVCVCVKSQSRGARDARETLRFYLPDVPGSRERERERGRESQRPGGMYTAGNHRARAQNSLSAPSLAEAASQRVVRARSVTIMEPFEDRRVQHADTPPTLRGAARHDVAS